MVRQDEDFGGGNRVEPFLDPSPNGWEESRSANDLGRLSAQTLTGPFPATYEYTIQCLWVMCSCQCTRVLHMTSQVPELLEPDI